MKGTNTSSAAVLASSKKRRRGRLAQPVRQFDATVGAITARKSNAVASSVARIATVDEMAPEVRPRRYLADIRHQKKNGAAVACSDGYWLDRAGALLNAHD